MYNILFSMVRKIANNFEIDAHEIESSFMGGRAWGSVAKFSKDE